MIERAMTPEAVLPCDSKSNEDQRRPKEEPCPKKRINCSERSRNSRDNLGHLLTWTDVLSSFYIIYTVKIRRCVTGALARPRLEFIYCCSAPPMLSLNSGGSTDSEWWSAGTSAWHLGPVLQCILTLSRNADPLTELAESCCTSICCMAGKVLSTVPVVHNEQAVDTCLLVLPVFESFSQCLNWIGWLSEKEKGFASCFKAEAPWCHHCCQIPVTLWERRRRIPFSQRKQWMLTRLDPWFWRIQASSPGHHNFTRWSLLSFGHQHCNCLRQ